MSSLGQLALLAAFVVASYAATISVVGARRRSTPLIESGIGAHALVSALLALASAVLISSFVSQDYSIKYVAANSDAAQPLFYRVTAFWGGLDGSILFWAVLLSICAVVAIRANRETQRELIPYVVTVVALVEMFFIFLMIVHNNPFDTFLAEVPADGRGMNPLLQTPLMVIHPPALYTGFVGMTIPFAFGLAALITGHLDDSWLLAVRRWTMIGWLFLSFGLTLGMIWAYEELGWGGYWGWDPVENAGLLPWFTATAFLHSLMVQERRGMMRVWNVTLVILTFLLTIFGTFMTRSGVVQSVHAFGEDKELAWLFTAFMIVTAAISFGLVIYRLPLLRARHELDSWVSKEAAFLVNNWILLFSAHLRPVRDAVPDAERSADGAAADGRAAVLQHLDAADRPGAAGADRRRAAPGVAQEHGRQPARSVPVPGRGRGADRWGAGGARRPFLGLGPVLRALRVRDGHDGAGVLPRRAGAPGHHRHRSVHGAGRPLRPAAAPLRRLRRPPRHRADVPRLRR